MKWLVVLLLAGCASTLQNGFDLDAGEWEHDRKDLRARGSFELKCAPETLQFTVLKTNESSKWAAANQVGVEGCGHRLVYVREPGAGWVLNSSDGEGK
jgi:hypothetical protein